MGRHDTDIVSMVFGLVFIVIGVLFLIGGVDAGDFVRMWALPMVLMAAGLVFGAFGVTSYQRTKREPYEGAPDGDDESHPPLW